MEPIYKKVIYSKNPHQKLCPASMTKMNCNTPPVVQDLEYSSINVKAFLT